MPLSKMENSIIVTAMEPAPVAQTVGTEVTIDLEGRSVTTTHHPGATILQTARQAGLRPPSSCEAGNCATCMARLVEGAVEMKVNDALDDDEVAEGWILTCQSVPTSSVVHVAYGFED
jgi:ferredoxin